MKIAVSSQGTTIDAQMDERFGRAAYILIVDTDTLAVEVLDNSANISAAQGAGIQAASMVSAKGAKALLTGSCGPKAMNAFQAVNIDVYTGQSGTVREAVERFRNGGLKPVNAANVGEKYGMSGMPGVGPSPNRSAAMSYGGGMGFGMGNPVGPVSMAPSKAETVEDLKKQAEILKPQLDAIQKKIESL